MQRPGSTGETARHGSLRRLVGFALPVGLGFALAGLVGFLAFAASLERQGQRPLPRADGIVALTGGADRIEAALNLLAGGHARRLLISGVSPLTTFDDLRRRWPLHEALFACCIDLDHEARNTFENAAESARWAGRHGFASLLIVTASYHMPRTLIEFETALPRAALHPVPVVPEASRLSRWWQDPTLMRIMAFEFIKYTAAILRTTLRIPGR